jgi:23S rRNA (uracil1939-C5)-methyltransferase
MTVKKGETIQLSISGVAFGGKGLSRVDGLTVFVEQAVPGDLVLARIVKKKKNYAEARVIELRESSPSRIVPPCPYSGICGGCTWQFLVYARQLEHKRQHVSESLAHIGGIEGVAVHPTIPSEKIFAYRNKMEFSCSDRSWLLREEMEQGASDLSPAVGLHVPEIYHKVLDIEACLLQPDAGNRILRDFRRFLLDSGLPVYGLRSHVGFWRFLMLRHSTARDEWMVNIITAGEDRKAVQPLADRLMERYPEVVSVVNNITTRKSGVALGEYEVPLAGTPFLTDRIGSFEFDISANSFFQTNTLGAEALYRVVKSYAGLTGGETVLDLYSGTGTIAIYLSDASARVIGIEMAESAIADAEKNRIKNRVDNCRFLEGDMRRVLAGVSEIPDVMIIDPPRVGMHKDVTARVLEMAPERIVYVSCNPATLARDLAMMKDAYRVEEVQPVDLFPHTFHVEAVARLEKR